MLELLCLRETEYAKPEGGGYSEEKTTTPQWKNKSIIDIARLGKMDKLIDHPIIQGDLNSTYYGVFSSASGNGWHRFAAFILSLFTLGALAPILLKYERQFVMKKWQFWEDIGPRETPEKSPKKVQEKSPKNTNGNPPNDDEKIPEKSPTKPPENKNDLCSWLSQYWNHVMLFHSSPRTKMCYSMMSEIGIAFYFSFYLRNELRYYLTVHDFVLLGLVFATIIGKFKATLPSLAKDSQSALVKNFRNEKLKP